MKPPFDIAGDLDTPVSAFAKLAPFEPRFLLESVEGGERLGRYSFIGFGDALEVRLDDRRLSCIGAEHRAAPRTQARVARRRCAALAAGAAAAAPSSGTVPLAGGLVGFTGYDVVRFFERLPQRWRGRCRGCRCCTTWRRARCWCSITSAAASRCCTPAAMPSARRCGAR